MSETVETTTETPQETPPTPQPGRGAQALQSLMDADFAKQTQVQEQKKSQAEIEEANRIRMLVKNNPTQLLREAGVDVSSLKPADPDPLSDVSKEVNQLKEALRVSQEREAERERQEQLEQARQLVIEHIGASEQHPFVKALPDFQNVVFDRMVQAAQSGQSLSEHDATQEVEDWLVQTTVPAVVEVLKGNDELMSQFFPEYIRQGQPQVKQTPLTNHMSADTPVKDRAGRRLSEQEEIEQMVSMLKFT